MSIILKSNKPAGHRSGLRLLCKGKKQQPNLELHITTDHSINELIAELMISVKRLENQVNELHREDARKYFGLEGEIDV